MAPVSSLLWTSGSLYWPIPCPPCNSPSCCPDQMPRCLACRCFAKSLSCPDEAEGMAREVCEAGSLQPNATTHNLLATMRLRYEQLCG